MNDEQNHIVEYLLRLRKTDPGEYQEILRILSVEEIHQPGDTRTKNLRSHSLENPEPKKCESCGNVLGSFESKICGPCRMKNPKIHNESFE